MEVDGETVFSERFGACRSDGGNLRSTFNRGTDFGEASALLSDHQYIADLIGTCEEQNIDATCGGCAQGGFQRRRVLRQRPAVNVAVHSAQREAGAKLDAFRGIEVLGLGGLRSRRNSCLVTPSDTVYGAWWRFRDIKIASGCTSD